MSHYWIRPFSAIRNNLKIRGILYMPKGEGPFPGLIVCQSVFESQKDYLKIGERFAEDGIATILFDYTNSPIDSSSDGTPYDLTVFTQSEDIKTVINETLRNEQINHAFLLGFDEGALAAGIAAKEMKDDVDALIYFYPSFNLPEEIRKLFQSKEMISKNNYLLGTNLSSKFYKVLFDMDWKEAVSEYLKPVLVFHGSKDPIVPVEYAREAIVIYPRGQIVELKDETHNFKDEVFTESLEISIHFIEICNALEEYLELHQKRNNKF